MKDPKYDDMLDPAYAAIYHQACLLEKEGRIEPDMDTDSMCCQCKKLAAEFVDEYKEAVYRQTEPDYWDMLDTFAEKRLKELWPIKRVYEVTITHRVYASSEDAAVKIATDPKNLYGTVRVKEAK